jgi:hypothetical protein
LPQTANEPLPSDAPEKIRAQVDLLSHPHRRMVEGRAKDAAIRGSSQGRGLNDGYRSTHRTA